ncbi:hypothetical protein WCLP8_1820001 [uncultured Gammaproteobacteria bacterium]
MVDRVLAEEMAHFQRLPQLKFRSTLPTDLPLVRADADLLRRAVAGLAHLRPRTCRRPGTPATRGPRPFPTSARPECWTAATAIPTK